MFIFWLHRRQHRSLSPFVLGDAHSLAMALAGPPRGTAPAGVLLEPPRPSGSLLLAHGTTLLKGGGRVAFRITLALGAGSFRRRNSHNLKRRDVVLGLRPNSLKTKLFKAFNCRLQVFVDTNTHLW